MATYSRRFLLLGVGTNSQVYTVPDGKRAVIRNVTAYSETAGLLFYALAHGVLIWLWVSPGARAFTAFETRMVLYERETLSATKDAGTTTLSCSGYEFDDPVGKPPATKPVEPDPPVVNPLEVR